jgi:hypothetical protein
MSLSTMSLRPLTRARLALRVALGVSAIVAPVAAAGCAAASMAGMAAAPVPPGMNFGSGYEATFQAMPAAQQTRVMTSVAASGTAEMRVDVPFDGQEDQRGHFYWHSDAEIAQALGHGIHVLATIGFAPSWAEESDGSPNPTQFAAFAAAVAAHYGPMGVHDYEIWNEPNLQHYWEAPVTAGEYAALLKATYPAIKAADRASTVITGGLAPAPDNRPASMGPMTYLNLLYRDGAGKYFDAVGDHPYSHTHLPTDPESWNPWTYLPGMHTLMAANGDGNKKIWLTEYGAATSGPSGVSLSRQALMITQAFRLARSWSWAGPLFVFDWQDDAVDGPMGLHYSDGSAKPALSAFRQAAHG